MTQRSVQYLKTKFETSDIPTQSDYQDVFDSFVSLEASATQTLSGKLVMPSILASGAVSAESISVSRVRTGQQSITPTGTTQASAFAVTADIVRASAEQEERSIVLPSLEPGRVQFVMNSGTTALLVFPPTGQNFIGSAANGGISVPTLTGVTIPHMTSAYGFIR
jgi:hypothetical protein